MVKISDGRGWKSLKAYVCVPVVLNRNILALLMRIHSPWPHLTVCFLSEVVCFVFVTLSSNNFSFGNEFVLLDLVLCASCLVASVSGSFVWTWVNLHPRSVAVLCESSKHPDGHKATTHSLASTNQQLTHLQHELSKWSLGVAYQ